MRRFTSFIVICFLLFIAPPSCISTTPTIDLDYDTGLVAQVDSPEESYVHFQRVYSVELITGPRRYASSAAGGVCIASDGEGCFVVTVNHFCEVDKDDEPDLPNIRQSLHAQNMFGDSTTEVEIIDTMPEADLCLIRVAGNSFHQARGLTIPSLNERFSELENYGAPAGHFNGSTLWNLSMYEGRWSGYCTERCAIPDIRISYDNLIVHTIPTTRGQSGSPIFIGNLLFGIQVATNASIEDFGIAASSRSIYLLLERNNIHGFVGIEE